MKYINPDLFLKMAHRTKVIARDLLTHTFLTLTGTHPFNNKRRFPE